jgi:hypothetical protein
MDYLTEMAPIYSYKMFAGWVHERQHDEVVWDDYAEQYVTHDTGVIVERTSERPALWWCVAVYTSNRAYGGPEEGGWWYSCGGLVEHAKIKFFDKYQDAYDYTQELWAWCMEENKDRGDEKLVVRAFTEQLPDMHYPKTQPFYS